MKHGKATDEVTEEQVKVSEPQISVTNFVCILLLKMRSE
jgi:hypothetical protein